MNNSTFLPPKELKFSRQKKRSIATVNVLGGKKEALGTGERRRSAESSTRTILCHEPLTTHSHGLLHTSNPRRAALLSEVKK